LFFFGGGLVGVGGSLLVELVVELVVRLVVELVVDVRWVLVDEARLGLGGGAKLPTAGELIVEMDCAIISACGDETARIHMVLTDVVSACGVDTALAVASTVEVVACNGLTFGSC
jgi:hypothetical protein